jgi:hypothetical protein
VASSLYVGREFRVVASEEIGMKRIVDRHWVPTYKDGHYEEVVRYEPENDWERNHLELLTIGPLGPCGCLDCADEILSILRVCAKEHGVEWK